MTPFAKVLPRNANNVAKETFKDFLTVLVWIYSVIKTRINGIIMTPSGGRTKLPIISPIAAIFFPHFEPPALSTK